MKRLATIIVGLLTLSTMVGVAAAYVMPVVITMLSTRSG